MSKPAQTKPITRQLLAESLGICTKSLSRFLQKENIIVPPRALLRPKVISEIIRRYYGDDDVSN